MSRPTALGKDCVFSVYGSSVIDASRDRVWDALTDFASYPQWNSFVRKQVITDTSKTPLDDQTPAVDKYIYAYPVHMPPTLDDSSVGLFNKSSVFLRIIAADSEGHKVAWVTHGVPKWILWSERWQWLTECMEDPGDGKGQRKMTKYESMEMFGGFVAYFVNWFAGKNLKLGFQAQADDLKRWAERIS